MSYIAKEIVFCPQRVAEVAPTELRAGERERMKGDRQGVLVRRRRALDGVDVLEALYPGVRSSTWLRKEDTPSAYHPQESPTP